ncbi:MAG: hypothetical protein KTR35_08035 [Gammaproteobacteria bacterium]|nr:hypothetical protein [Gammaproteobacteria bacterium]
MIETQQSQQRPPVIPDVDDNDTEEPAAVPTPVQPTVVDPSTHTDNTADGPMGGDPEEFEALTGQDSDWSFDNDDDTDSPLAAGSVIVAPAPFWPSVWNWFVSNLLRPVTTGASAAGAAVVGGLVALFYPRPAGEGSDQVSSNMQMEVLVNAEDGSGELIVDGENTGINVVPTGHDENGNPTGYGPATEEDAAALSELTGTEVNVGDTIGSTDPADPIDTADGEDVRTINTGNEALDEVLEGSVPTDSGNKGWETPQTQEEFEEELRDIPGAEVEEHSGGGVTATLPDGTEVTTYPERTSTGHPGYSVESPDGTITKGSLVGSDS